MSIGSDDPPTPPQLPPPPPPADILDVIDELSGTQTLTVTGPHGKKQRVVQRLPRTAEEESLYKQAGMLMDKAVGEIKRLYESNPQKIANFAPFVQTLNQLNTERTQDMQALTQFPDFGSYVQSFKDMQMSLIDDQYSSHRTAMEERLAHQGLSSSTVGREERALLERNAIQARQQAGVQAQQYGQDLVGSELNNRASLYNLRETNRQGRLSSAAGEYDLEKESLAQQDAQRQQALQQQYNMFGVASQIKDTDQGKAMATLAPNLALAEFGANNQQAMNQHMAKTQQIQGQYSMDLAHHRSKPVSFGKGLLQLGGFIGGGMLAGPAGSVLGGWGSKVFGGK